MGYGVDIVDAKGEEEARPVVEVYRVGRGGVEMGERVKVGEGGVEVRVLRAREYYEARSGCKWSLLLRMWVGDANLWCSLANEFA